jgi:predicted nucleotide-binding protein (sugar kinase/HSP70/actin superfamily)
MSSSIAVADPLATGAHFADDYSCVIDSDGNAVQLNDPRVCHILTIDISPYASAFLSNRFARRGWKCRTAAQTTKDVMQCAKAFGTGRECVPCMAIMGATYKDMLENRLEDEISIYYNLDQEGPCQNGAWPIVWDGIRKRKEYRNVVFVSWPSVRNNYLGKGESMAIDLALSVTVGDLLDEAEYALKVLAEDRARALEVFELETKKFIESGTKGLVAIEEAWRRWARNLKKVPRKATVEEMPHVLLFSGANLIFIHYPVSEFFIERGVIPKLVDFAEFIIWLESEDVTRYGFSRGLTRAKEQFHVPSLVLSLANPKNWTMKALRAVRCRAHIGLLDFTNRTLRRLAKSAGLLYDKPIPFATLAAAGNEVVSVNGFTETCVNTGRYAVSAQGKVFDALVNVSSFNCQPAMNTQACVRALANKSDIPYASIDCEGPWISANQQRLLETIAVQAKRGRRKRLDKSVMALSQDANVQQADVGL